MVAAWECWNRCNCDYTLIGPESARKIEDAYARLTRGEVDGMTAIGVTYQA